MRLTSQHRLAASTYLWSECIPLVAIALSVFEEVSFEQAPQLMQSYVQGGESLCELSYQPVWVVFSAQGSEDDLPYQS